MMILLGCHTTINQEASELLRPFFKFVSSILWMPTLYYLKLWRLLGFPLLVKVMGSLHCTRYNTNGVLMLFQWTDFRIKFFSCLCKVRHVVWKLLWPDTTSQWSTVQEIHETTNDTQFLAHHPKPQLILGLPESISLY
jgi:hypothetical protein